MEPNVKENEKPVALKAGKCHMISFKACHGGFLLRVFIGGEETHAADTHKKASAKQRGDSGSQKILVFGVLNVLMSFLSKEKMSQVSTMKFTTLSVCATSASYVYQGTQFFTQVFKLNHRNNSILILWPSLKGTFSLSKTPAKLQKEESTPGLMP